MTQQIDQVGLDFIKGFESFVAYPYDDLLPPVNGRYREWAGGPVKGTLTIGYGHTNAAIYPLRIVPGLTLTEPEAAKILDVDLDECEAAVNNTVHRPINQGQYDALTSFAYNCGTGALANIVRRINVGDYDDARAAFDLYVYSKGQKLAGLQRRRDGEQALWDQLAPSIPTEIVHHSANVDEPEDWAWVQQQLNDLGLYTDRVDGSPGPHTEAGVVAFIKKYNPKGLIQ